MNMIILTGIRIRTSIDAAGRPTIDPLAHAPRLEGRNPSMASFDGFVSLLLLLGIASLVPVAAAGVCSIRSLRQLRRETIDRHGELDRRLRTIEARFEKNEARGGKPAGRTRAADDTIASLPDAWRKDPAVSVPARPMVNELRDSPTLIAVPALATPSSKPLESPEGGLDERHAEILALAATGSSPGEIARRTGQPIGQVELVLGLHRQIHSSRGPTDDARAD
jgi:hypothetical protein